ncbi:basic proline-rich protein-like [Sorex fumeus]|uniref:basic proline-rich protein-like n=1 Tax=Sorex fumeus TaxID=62283 RepID=UPI0024AD3CBB|nr:basic proline-rich protein-like [Sorex fumeus]
MQSGKVLGERREGWQRDAGEPLRETTPPPPTTTNILHTETQTCWELRVPREPPKSPRTPRRTSAGCAPPREPDVRLREIQGTAQAFVTQQVWFTGRALTAWRGAAAGAAPDAPGSATHGSAERSAWDAGRGARRTGGQLPLPSPPTRRAAAPSGLLPSPRTDAERTGSPEPTPQLAGPRGGGDPEPAGQAGSARKRRADSPGGRARAPPPRRPPRPCPPTPPPTPRAEPRGRFRQRRRPPPPRNPHPPHPLLSSRRPPPPPATHPRPPRRRARLRPRPSAARASLGAPGRALPAAGSAAQPRTRGHRRARARASGPARPSASTAAASSTSSFAAASSRSSRASSPAAAAAAAAASRVRGSAAMSARRTRSPQRLLSPGTASGEQLGGPRFPVLGGSEHPSSPAAPVNTASSTTTTTAEGKGGLDAGCRPGAARRGEVATSGFPVAPLPAVQPPPIAEGAWTAPPGEGGGDVLGRGLDKAG